MHDFSLKEGKFSVKGSKESQYLIVLRFKPQPFIKSLANHIIDMKIELVAPLHSKQIKRILKKKFRCFNSKTYRLNQEQKKTYHSLSIYNSADVPFKIENITICGNEVCASQPLTSGEFYSTFFLNKQNLDSIPTIIRYKLDSKTLIM